MKDGNILFDEFLEELKCLFFVEVLDNVSFFDDVWFKKMIDKLF